MTTIEFRYQKDIMTSKGEDNVSIDDIQVTGQNIDWWPFYQVNDPLSDVDHDGLSNQEEFKAFTNPHSIDSDFDGLTDQEEIHHYKTNPLKSDSDNDGISDFNEIKAQLNPMDPNDALKDKDGDGDNNLIESLYAGKINDSVTLAKGINNKSDILNTQKLSKQWNFNPKNIYFSASYPKIFSYLSGTRGWEIKNDSLEANPITHHMAAVMEYTDFFEAGQLHFNLQLNTEKNADKVYIFVDQKPTKINGISGIQDLSRNIELTRGEHTIRFVYIKDAQKSSILDFVRIENIRYQTF
jgi:hypothetical protein